MKYFLQDVARYLLKKNQGDFRRTVIVFPGRRARLFFNYFLSRIIEKPLWAPRYFSISDFVQKLSGLQLADPLTLAFRLYKTYKQITSSAETFDNFYYYAEVILSDFDDIDKYRINAADMYRNLSDLKAIEDYKEYLEEFQIDAIRNFWDIIIHSRESDEKEQFLSIWDALGAIYSEFGNSLEKEGLAYEGMAYRRAVDRLNSGQEPELFNSEIVFVGFNALNHSEELLFNKFKAGGKALFFWDYDKSYIESDFHEAGFFLRDYLRRYSQPPDFCAGNHISGTEQNITTIAVPASVSQAKIIGKCLEITGSDTIESPLKTALVLADESLLMPVVNSLPKGIENVNISLGYPVIDTPAFGFLSALTDLQKNRRKIKGKEGKYEYYHNDLFTVLGHSFLTHISGSEEIQIFRKECRQKNLVYIDPDNIKLKSSLIRLICEAPEEPVQFGGYLCKILERVAELIRGNDEPAITVKWQLEILFAIHKVLMRFEILIRESGIGMSFSTVFSLLRRILKGISVPFAGEPLTGLQVMGILETRALDFENIIILSMNEGKFPKSSHIPSLIPFALREAFGLPTINHQDAIFGYYFYRLLHRSRNVILVYNTKTEGLQKGEPSRFILQLRYERPVPPLHLDMGYEIGPYLRKTIEIKKTKKVFEALSRYQNPGGSSFISPSALNTFIDCSLKFYFKYIEELAEPDQISEQIGADVFGRILHKAMSVLYKPLYGKECDAKTIHTIRKNQDRVHEAVKQAFANEYFMKKRIDAEDFRGKNFIIKRVIEQYVDGILAYDSQSAPTTIQSTEEKYFTSVKPEGIDTELRLGGYIDRLDIMNGKLRVVDYKTGKRNSEFSTVESLFSRNDKKRNSAVFQTFLYSWILSKEDLQLPVQPVLFYVRDIYQSDFSPLIIQSENRIKNFVGNFNDYAGAFETGLINLINELYDTNISFSQTADIEQCKRCPYNEICLRETD